MLLQRVINIALLVSAAVALVRCDPPVPTPVAPSQADQAERKSGTAEKDR